MVGGWVVVGTVFGVSLCRTGFGLMGLTRFFEDVTRADGLDEGVVLVAVVVVTGVVVDVVLLPIRIFEPTTIPTFGSSWLSDDEWDSGVLT